MTARAAASPQVVLRRETRFIRVVLTLLLLAALALACMLAVGGFGRRRPFYAPQPLRSGLLADYSADPFADKVAGFGPDLVEAIIRDEAATDAPERLATVVSELLTPVPTVVNSNPLQPTETPPPSATLAVIAASPTLAPATSTNTGEPSPTASATDTAPPPTDTAVPPTATVPIVPPTRTNTPLPTFTLVPPTWTLPPPTNTFPPPPTDTAVPPTNPPPPTDYVPPPTDPPADTPVPPPTEPSYPT